MKYSLLENFFYTDCVAKWNIDKSYRKFGDLLKIFKIVIVSLVFYIL